MAKNSGLICITFTTSQILLKITKNFLPGIIIHAAGVDSSGIIHVADIWESEQDFSNYLNSKLKPAMEKINLPVPMGELFPIHNVNAFQGIESYKVK